MEFKTIKVSEENYIKLLKIAARLQNDSGERASFDDALSTLTQKEKKKDIMDLAGLWEMSDEEYEEFMKGIKGSWRKWEIPSV